MSIRKAPWVLCAAVACASPALAGDPPPARGPVSVFVKARADEAEKLESEKQALRAKADAADASFQRMRKDMRKELGKDLKKWPSDRRRTYFDALDKLGVAWSESYYYARPGTEKADSVEDFQKHLAKGKRKYLTLASSPAEADLVVEVMGRKGMAKFMRGTKYLGFDVHPGRVPAAALTSLAREQLDPWWGDDHLFTLHWPKDGAPYFRFEVSDEERWSDVAGWGVDLLDEMAKTYYDTLKPAS